MIEAGSKIRSFKDWKREMLKLAEGAVSENRLMNAAFYFRAAEFYTTPKDVDKEFLYDRFIEFFYGVFRNDEIERDKVSYEGAFLSARAIRLKTAPAYAICFPLTTYLKCNKRISRNHYYPPIKGYLSIWLRLNAHLYGG